MAERLSWNDVAEILGSKIAEAGKPPPEPDGWKLPAPAAVVVPEPRASE